MSALISSAPINQSEAERTEEMPKNPLNEMQRRRKSGELNRIEKLANNAAGITSRLTREISLHDGTPVYLKPRAQGGLIVGQGQTRIVLDSDEAALLIRAAVELTKPASERALSPAKKHARELGKLMVYPATPAKG
jgi:Fe2+ transport system protein FeoA